MNMTQAQEFLADTFGKRVFDRPVWLEYLNSIDEVDAVEAIGVLRADRKPHPTIEQFRYQVITLNRLRDDYYPRPAEPDTVRNHLREARQQLQHQRLKA